ncbi:LOW QUALITY PROTEIN: mitochondrial RNA pseudouridine synthase RPUSD4 [Rana temporaria]|uniref:LOW QUALITY PROTEIN: mitochondrial RNA pseudouridine synthase RPUSD4 n=1 Tax=Rana temporaria TaxID=8407 RepID=UPI001AAD1C95|nr:LOW QUALITY PROTEIN: mitochondrial RNA pseudouridine synthase RPUSD4 [Rana temporaria]
MAAAGGTRGARRLAERLRAEKILSGRSQITPRSPTVRDLRSWPLPGEAGLILINKPSGLPTHGGPGVERSVVSLLPALSRSLFGGGAEPLRICHRLDKDSSGALLLAQSAGSADRVQRALREHRMSRVYWALCVGAPTPPEGILDIPLIEKETPGPQKHFKMALCPRFRVSSDGSVQRFRVSRSAHEAVTQYRTLEKSSGVSLLELRPLTGVKHQLRSHMALALNCPILGDHKYSHWGRLAPQKLPAPVLRSLGIPSPQSRSLLLHLHAAQITLQLSPRTPPLVLRCAPPKHFLSALRRLKFSPQSLQDIPLPPDEGSS